MTLKIFLVIVALTISLPLVAACAPCPDHASPCPKPFDLGRYCASSGQCTLDGKPADCQGFSGCRIEPGKTLQIPLAQVDSILLAHDLRIAEVNGGSPGSEGDDFSIRIDGVAGTPDHEAPYTFFTWAPPNTAPALFEARYDGANTFDLAVSVVDARCEIANPQELCPI
jgi:hypothetical protein